jgi:hypothetical protein
MEMYLKPLEFSEFKSSFSKSSQVTLSNSCVDKDKDRSTDCIKVVITLQMPLGIDFFKLDTSSESDPPDDL